MDDIDNGISIHRKQRQLHEGKMTRPTSTKAYFQRMKIPKHVQDRFNEGVQLEFDIMFVDKITFCTFSLTIFEFQNNQKNYRSLWSKHQKGMQADRYKNNRFPWRQ